MSNLWPKPVIVRASYCVFCPHCGRKLDVNIEQPSRKCLSKGCAGYEGFKLDWTQVESQVIGHAFNGRNG